ncbi:hypothetical protein [Streptomyces sp. SGAir0957]
MSHPAATTTRRLLRALAAPPPAEATGPTVNELHETTLTIHTHLTNADRTNAPTITAQTLLTWRSALDRLHRALEHTTPRQWAQWRAPGTWIDSQLRLRSLITHEIAKAYWNETTEIRYDAIDIERYLWGAR